MPISRSKEAEFSTKPDVALLTGGADRPYAFGLAQALIAQGVSLDLIANDDLDCAEFRNRPGVNFLNLRGDQRPDAALSIKMFRIIRYYARLIRYAATAKPPVFHILWNNKFELLDRTLLMVYYKVLGRKIVLTLHNVNGRRRDSRDSILNRMTLRFQYRTADHLFVHTEKMKQELVEEFGEKEARISVIPFGINNAVPNTELTPEQARRRLGLEPEHKAVLFFGNIAPYKGLEYLITAFLRLAGASERYRLIVAGRPKNCESYWNQLCEQMREPIRTGQILVRSDYIPDEETEVYFKAADVLVLPYRYIYQSGVLFLGYSFGLPVLVSDVGSLRDEVVEGSTGFIFRPEDPEDLAQAIERYFASNLYVNLSRRRQQIFRYAVERNSWEIVAGRTIAVYGRVAGIELANTPLCNCAAATSFDPKTGN